jgi:putative phosphoesterase
VKKQLKIGIVADTHDNLPLVDKAVERLNREKVELVLHAGDYVAPFTVLRFRQLKARLIGVFGNNDGDHEYLKRRFADVKGAEIRGTFAEVNIDGLKIALLHDEGELFQSLVSVQCYDVVVHGHTHEARVYKKGRTTVINPGEVCGYLSRKSTMALLDTKTREARIIQL